MQTATATRILLCADQPGTAGEVCLLLERAGHTADCRGLDRLPSQDFLSHDLVIVEGSRAAEAFCRRLRAQLHDAFLPILFLTDGHDPEARVRGLESGADVAASSSADPAELVAQVQALVRLKRLTDRLSAERAQCQQLNQKLQQAYEQVDQELLLARRVQQSLLPQTLPDMPPARFAVRYRPCGRVGGDFYDVFRLDEDHVGFYVADVVGHGLPACLLTIFLKRAVQAKEIHGKEYRLLAPDEVLGQLNRELIAQELAENPFITMIYALFNRRDLSLSFARAGHPYPLYIPRKGDPQFWKVHGTLLGIFQTQFAVQTQRLCSGDKVLFCTDGLETAGSLSEWAGSDRLLHLSSQYRDLDIDELVDRLARDLFAQADQPDDFTLLGLEIAR